MDTDVDRDKSRTIQDVVTIGHALSRLVISPDLDQWRQLNVPVAQLKSLFLIVNRRGMNSRLLARELDVTPGNVTGLVDRLAEQDLVIRKPDSEDRRVTWLEATPKGRELLDRLLENRTRKVTSILQYMSPGDLESLKQGLQGLLSAVEDHLDVIKNDLDSSST